MQKIIKKGKDNTEIVLENVKEYLNNSDIKEIVIATTHGDTVEKAIDILGSDYNYIAVTHCTGFKEDDVQDLDDKIKEKLENRGVKVLTTTHAMGTLGRAVKNKFGAIQIDEIIANSLRIFGQGTKVCAEIAMMAADAGLISVKEDCLVIAGSGKGADTAIILKPTNTHNFFDMKIREIICKPFEF